MARKIVAVITLVAAALIGSLAVHFIPLLLKIDDCFDSGGCWDYANEECEYEDQCKCTPERPSCEGSSEKTRATKGPQRVVNFCDSNECPKCEKDEDCRMSSNPCHDTAYCTTCFPTSSGGCLVQPAPTTIACSEHYDVPPDSACKCVSGLCRAID